MKPHIVAPVIEESLVVEGGQWREFAASLPPAQYLMQTLIPRGGKTIVHGPPSAGKSALLWHIGQSIAEGVPCLGFTTVPSKVLLLSVDMNFYAINLRWGTEFTPTFSVACPPKFNCLDDGFSRTVVYRDLRRYVESAKVDLILLDAIGGIHAGITALNDETATGVDAVLSSWFPPPMSFILLAHDRKARVDKDGRPVKKSEEDILGSQMWRSNCISQIQMSAVGHGISVIKHQKSQVAAAHEETIRVCIDDYGRLQLWDRASADEARAKYAHAVDKESLRSASVTQQVNAVASFYKVSTRTVKRWRAKLRDDDKEAA